MSRLLRNLISAFQGAGGSLGSAATAAAETLSSSSSSSHGAASHRAALSSSISELARKAQSKSSSLGATAGKLQAAHPPGRSIWGGENENVDAASLFSTGNALWIQGHNKAKAVELWKQASEMGHLDARYSYASCLRTGEGMDKANYQEAEALFHSLSDAGHAPGKYAIAVMISSRTDPVPTDLELTKCLELFKEAAKAGLVPAAYNVAAFLMAGKGSPKDEEQASKWLYVGAEAGDPTCSYTYANWLCSGRGGLMKDVKKGFHYQQRAAEAGFPRAQFNLGCHFFRGEGVEQDLGKALEWWQRAGHAGMREAQLNVSKIYATGLGGVVAVSREDALMWMKLALGDEEVSDADLEKELDRVMLVTEQNGTADVDEKQPADQAMK